MIGAKLTSAKLFECYPQGVPILTNDRDLLEKLEKLAKLKQEGVLTDDEFQKLKSQILPREISKTNKDFMIYENPTYGIKIKYPSDMEGTELGHTLQETEGIRIVEFGFPPRSASGTYKGIVCIDIKDLSSKNMSLDSYTQQQIFHLRKIHKNFKVIESTSTILSNSPAHKVLFTYSHTDPIYLLNIKSLRIWTIKNEKAYHILYSARGGEFLPNLPVTQSIMNSLEIANLIISPETILLHNQEARF
jgi:hypothetical protein